MLLSLLKNFIVYTNSELSKTFKISNLLKTSYENKILYLGKKNFILSDRNLTLEEVIRVLLKKIENLEVDKLTLVTENNKITHETKERFKDLKSKMVQKLNSKNQEINQYESYFGDLEKKLKDLETL
jgi:hypothetical protein